ncbi:MAG: hypothetical protein P4L65_03720 [Legionella sp.]|nr:hypothetical protein [Legionella sp.]
MTTSSGVLQSYLLQAIKEKKKVRPEDLLAHFQEIKKQKKLAQEEFLDLRDGDFLTPLNFYLGILDSTDSILIKYMEKAKQTQLRDDLRVTYLLLLTQYEFERTHQKTENKIIYAEQIQRTRALIKKCCDSLEDLDEEYQEIINKAPEQAWFSDGKPIKYLGIEVAHEIAKDIVDMMDDKSRLIPDRVVNDIDETLMPEDGLNDHKSKTTKDGLRALNEKRLYWIWASVFLKTVLSLVPEDFYNSGQAADAVKTPDPYTGCLSWSLYYFRFSLNLFLLLKHTIRGPWMEQAEKDLPWTERFQTQWAQRKFTLLNDSLWGTANLACYFWLNGKGALGAWGDALTIVLLVFDLSVALWDFEEQQTKYEKSISQFDKDMVALKQQISDLNADSDATRKSENEKQIALCRMRLDALEREKTHCQQDWELQKLALYNDVAYATGLILAFVLLTTPFMPLSAAAAMSLGIAGAVLCFAFTVINNAIKSGLAITKSNRSLKEARNDEQQQIIALEKLLKENPDLNDNEKQFLYLDIQRLRAETEYQKQMIVLQSVQLARSIMIEAMIPALIFACLVFFPLGIGLGVMGGALGLAIASNLLINALFKPDESKRKAPELNEEAYTKYCKNTFFGAPAASNKSSSVTEQASDSSESDDSYSSGFSQAL